MRRGTEAAVQFGEALLFIRTNNGLRQAEVARRLGNKANALVSQAEKGDRIVKFEALPIWAKALEVNEQYLTEIWLNANSIEDPPLKRNRAYSTARSDLDKLIRELNGSERDRVLGYIQALLDNRKP